MMNMIILNKTSSILVVTTREKMNFMESYCENTKYGGGS